jgi:hypothetical protein
MKPNNTLKFLKIPRIDGSLNLILFLFFQKYRNLVVLWFWKFSNAWNQRFFDSNFFFKYLEPEGITKIKYPPRTGLIH